MYSIQGNLLNQIKSLGHCPYNVFYTGEPINKITSPGRCPYNVFYTGEPAKSNNIINIKLNLYFMYNIKQVVKCVWHIIILT